MVRRIIFIIVLIFLNLIVWGHPRVYHCRYIQDSIVVDGREDDLWSNAEWSELFVDIEGNASGHGDPLYDTKVKMLWNDQYLYIYAWLEEEHIWANLKKRDAIIYNDNDFEVFIKPSVGSEEYFELEVNARNALLDLVMSRPYRNGGKALISWNAPGIKSVILIDGTLNNYKDIDRSWSVEMKIPFRDLQFFGDRIVPYASQFWRINFSRVQWEHEITGNTYTRKKGNNGKLLSEKNWVWSPQGVINMHYPEQWGFLFFTKEERKYEIPGVELHKLKVWDVYYDLVEHYRHHGTYSGYNPGSSIDRNWKCDKYLDKELFYLKLYPPDVGYYFIIDHMGHLNTEYYE